MKKKISRIKFGNRSCAKMIQSADDYIAGKNKIYFLLKKFKDYENRIQHKKMCSVRKMRKYESRWKYYEDRYQQINIYGVEFVSIGETISRLFMYLKDRKNAEKCTLDLVLPTFFPYYTAGIVNRSIFDVFGRNIHFITEKNIDFWKYIILFHSEKINIEHFEDYKFRDISVGFNIEIGKPLLPFSNSMIVYANRELEKMGVRDKYICIHAREVATKTKNFYSSYSDTSIIDADINSYGQACAYMSVAGYQSVRLGKDESQKCTIENVIDYANKFYDELMDFYLIANCKFLLGGMAGIIAIASFWGRPVLQTNAMSFCYGQESLPWTEYDLYIPKKYFSISKNRFLNLYEMWDVAYKCDRYNKRFEKEGIKVIDNTDEEILKATIEMNEKLDHTWIESEEERKCRKIYWQIINMWKSSHKIAYISRNEGGQGREILRRQICYSYLKENMYLLDVKELYEKY